MQPPEVNTTEIQELDGNTQMVSLTAENIFNRSKPPYVDVILNCTNSQDLMEINFSIYLFVETKDYQLSGLLKMNINDFILRK